MNPQTSELREPPVYVVLIDGQGIITGMQTHGRPSSRGSNPAMSRFVVGESYLDQCDNEANRADVLALLKRKRTLTSFVVSTRTPKAMQWFVMLGVPVSVDAGSGAVLMHVDITAWVPDMPDDETTPYGRQTPLTLNPAMLQDTISKALASQFGHAFAEEQQRTYQSHPDVESLSPRQREVLLLVGDGKSNLEISEELSCSLNTVKRHVTAVLQKLHLPNRTRAAMLVKQLNLTPTPRHRR
jgi:DNA-binding CsgD family transcriptional regulator